MFIQKGGDMTTITSHSLPLLPLRSNLSNLFGKRINDEPICPPSTKLIRLGASPKEDDDPLHRQQQMSPQDCYGSENSQSNNICDIIDRQSMNGMESSRFAISALTNDEMAISEPRSVNSMSSYKAEGMHNKDDDDDEMSYCSDDSELSVGKEVDDTISDKKTALFSHHHRIDDDSALHERNERLSMAAATTASRLQPKLPNIIRPSPTRQEEFLRKSHFYAEEIMKHQLNFMTVTKGLNISPKLSDNTFNYPVRPNALAPIHSAAINSPLKIGLSRLQAYANDNDLSKKWSVIDDRSSRSPEGTNFREIHSHLNAISKITSALGRDTCNRVQMTSPDSNASRENSQSPPTPHLQHFHHMLHNNFNETNLKFSIDNILKPSFGRRITDPLLKRNKTQRKNASQQRGAPPSINDGVAGKTTAIDSTTSTLISAGCKTPLSPPDQTVTKLSIPSPTSVSATGEQVDKSNASATAPASTAKSSNNNNSSIAWPAWVYCTRYSDRPSSGKLIL